jgi:hypothetical protein
MTAPYPIANRSRARAFTLPEVLVAGSIGVIITGFIMALLLDSGAEARMGFGVATVEDQAYYVEGQLTRNLHAMSANQGITPDQSTMCYAPNGSFLGYQGIYAFQILTNGTTVTEHIVFDPTHGTVTCVTNTAAAATSTVRWFTNSANCVVSNLWFNTSVNLDGSDNASLVNIGLEMNDNGYAEQNSTNNCATIYRSFSVQLRGD